MLLRLIRTFGDSVLFAYDTETYYYRYTGKLTIAASIKRS